MCKSIQILRFWCLILLLVFCGTGFAQKTDCAFSPTPLPLLYGKTDYEQLKQEAWSTLQCASQSSEIYISAISTLADIYRIYRKADSLEHYQNQAIALSNEHLPTTHTIALRCKLRTGLTALNNADYDTCFVILDELDHLYSKRYYQDKVLALDILRFRALYHARKEELDESLYSYQQGIELCDSLNNAIGEERKNTFYNLMAGVIESQGDPLRALEMTEKSIDYFFKYHDDTHPDAVAVYSNLGTDYWRTGFYQEAAYYLDKGYISLEKDGRADVVPTDVILNNMGAVYYQLGDIDKALDCFQKATVIRREAYGPEHLLTIVSIYNQGSMYAQRSQPQKTIETLEQARELLEKGGHSLDVAICNNNLAIAYRILGEYGKARKCYEEALEIYLDKYSGRLVSIANTQNNLGQLLIITGQYEEAKAYLRQSLDNLQQAQKTDSGKALYTQGIIAEADYLSGWFEDARARYKDIFSKMGLPADQDDLAALEDKESTLQLIESAINFHWAAYEKTQSEEELHQLISLAENGLELLQNQRNSAEAESSKVLLTHTYYTIYENAIQAQLALAQKDNTRRTKAFALNAQAKAGVLYDAIQLSGATSFVGVPADSLQRLRELKIQLSFIEKQLAGDAQDSTRQTNYQKQVFNIKRAIETTEQALEQIPAYAEITKTTEQLSEKEVSEMLPAKSAMINYFLGDHSLAIFVTLAGGDTYSYTQTLSDEFEDDLTSFLENLQQRPTSSPEQVGDYQKQAEALYELLLVDALSQIPVGTNHLIFVPDGILAYLPFGVLVKPSEQNYTRFADLLYLTKAYQISYAPSPIIWRSMSEAQVPAKGALVFAPSFGEEALNETASLATRKATLGPLFFNTEEAQNIGELTGSRLFTKREATLTNLNQYLEEADILHFATHAKVEENLPRYSYLAFSGPDSLPEQLFLSEIYNLDLKANMVVLSACETGLGRLQRGEGLISLARGFAYAGAKSIVPSLWSVNDQATASIMTEFYRQLADGQTKSSALQQAQFQYLNEQNDEHLAHPYYWAAFTIIGDNAPVQFGSGNNYLWFGLAAITGLLALLFVRRKDRLA